MKQWYFSKMKIPLKYRLVDTFTTWKKLMLGMPSKHSNNTSTTCLLLHDLILTRIWQEIFNIVHVAWTTKLATNIYGFILHHGHQCSHAIEMWGKRYDCTNDSGFDKHRCLNDNVVVLLSPYHCKSSFLNQSNKVWEGLLSSGVCTLTKIGFYFKHVK